MHKKSFVLTTVLLVVIGFVLVGCGGDSSQPQDMPVPPENTATSVPPTETPLPPTETPIPPSATPIPPTPEPIAIIRLSPGKFGSPLHLEVLKGSYKISSGATLRAGSAIDANEDWLTFPTSLEIEIGEGGATLNGKDYLAGTVWIVDADGNLVEK